MDKVLVHYKLFSLTFQVACRIFSGSEATCDPSPETLLCKYALGKGVESLNTLVDSHAELPKHYRDKSASTCAYNEMEDLVRLNIMI